VLAGRVVNGGEFPGCQVKGVDASGDLDWVAAAASSCELAFPFVQVSPCDGAVIWGCPRTLVRSGGGGDRGCGHQCSALRAVREVGVFWLAGLALKRRHAAS
jgi:hypothetical protein